MSELSAVWLATGEGVTLSEPSDVWLTIGKGVTKVVSDSDTVVCAGTSDGAPEPEGSAVRDERIAPGSEIGTKAVSVWPDLVITTGIDTMDGIAPLFEGCAKADEIAPPAFEIGREVTTVVSGRDSVN